MTLIDQKYEQLGGPNGFLGSPVVPEMNTSNGGAVRAFKNGIIASFPGIGAHEVHGLILKKWSKLGSQGGLLGFPRTDQTSTSGGKYNLFQRGVILYKGDTSEAFEVHGAIWEKYKNLDNENGGLGFPTSDERITSVTSGLPTVGRFSKFENGSIYWKPSVGAHEIRGLIHKYWDGKGRETNPAFGYPIADELPASPGSPNAFSDFENGVVYWKQGSPAAVQLTPNPLFSRPASTVIDSIIKGIQTAIKNLDIPGYKLYTRSGPLFATMKDYEQVTGGVRNRQYMFVVTAALEVPNSNDPDFTLTLSILVGFNRTTRAIEATLQHWKLKTEVDFPTTIFVSAKELNAQIEPKLNALAATPLSTSKVPSTLGGSKVNVLSVKAMPNGDLNCYTEPA